VIFLEKRIILLLLELDFSRFSLISVTISNYFCFLRATFWHTSRFQEVLQDRKKSNSQVKMAGHNFSLISRKRGYEKWVCYERPKLIRPNHKRPKNGRNGQVDFHSRALVLFTEFQMAEEIWAKFYRVIIIGLRRDYKVVVKLSVILGKIPSFVRFLI
jgi:hypothetical protein